MNRDQANNKMTRTALTLLIGVFALMFFVAGIGRTTVSAQQSGTATPAAEEETTTPAAEETPTATQDEEADATSTPAAEPEVTGTTTPEKGDAAPAGTPEATPEPLSEEELTEMGAELFTMYCAACHQADGQGIPDAYPALADNAFVVTEDPTLVLRVIFTGRAGMPHFRNAFSDREIASVVSYIRTAWDNDASRVSAEEVRTIEEEIYSPSEPMEHSGASE